MTLQDKYQEKFEAAKAEFEAGQKKELDELEANLAEWANIIEAKLEEVILKGLENKKQHAFPATYHIEVKLEKNDFIWNLRFESDSSNYGSNLMYVSSEKILKTLQKLLSPRGITYKLEGSAKYFFEVTFKTKA